MTVTYRRTSFRHKTGRATRWLLLALSALPALADEPLLALQFDSLQHESLELEHFSLQLTADADSYYQLEMQAARIDLPGDDVITDVRLQCQVTLNLIQLQCEQGRLALTHAGLGHIESAIRFRYNPNTGLEQASLTDVHLAGVQLKLNLVRSASDWQVQATIERSDLAHLISLAGQFGLALPNVDLASKLTGQIHGQISGQFNSDSQASGGALSSLRANLRFSGLNYSGVSVAQDVSGHLEWQAQREAGSWQNELQLGLDQGELYIVPPLSGYETQPGFYIDVPVDPVTLDAVFAYQPSGLLILQNIDYHHPQVIHLSIAGRLQLTPGMSIEALSVLMPTTDLSHAWPVYLQPLLIDSRFNDIKLSGRAALEFGLTGQQLSAFGMRLDNVAIHDPGDRFAVAGLSTDIQLTHARQHHSRIDWSGIDIYQLHLGSGAIELASDDLDIRVTDWQDVALLDGTLNIAELGFNGIGTDNFSMSMAGGVEEVSLAALTKALDWPYLDGTLTGKFSGLHYADGDVRMDGELQVHVFDGRVVLGDLAVRDLFGTLPVLTADIDVYSIDLESLTDTFSFGKITGRISGWIHGLKLESWRPVAFDARLSTQNDGDIRHRISQKALNNISEIGSGLSGALSRGFLSYFDEYSYGELGLSCRLENGFCTLGGVKSDEEGHYLMTRGGLLPPWVEVKLIGTKVEWDVLLDGFEQIAQGEVKIN